MLTVTLVGNWAMLAMVFELAAVPDPVELTSILTDDNHPMEPVSYYYS